MHHWEGKIRETKIKLEGNKVIIENISVYDGSIPISYRKEVIYHFKSAEEAQEYYYKKLK
jgi:hypothetical protein